jgi:hypothetical protein
MLSHENGNSSNKPDRPANFMSHSTDGQKTGRDQD